MKRYAGIIKTSRDSSDSGDKYTNPNNSAVLMGLKNVSTDISASGDSGDKKQKIGKITINCSSKFFMGRSRCRYYNLTATTAIENNFLMLTQVGVTIACIDYEA